MRKVMKWVWVVGIAASLAFALNFLIRQMIDDSIQKPEFPLEIQEKGNTNNDMPGDRDNYRRVSDDSPDRTDGSKPLKPFTTYGKTDGETPEKDHKDHEKVGSDYDITIDEIRFIANNISFKDKLTAAAIAGKISKGDADQILKLAQGGITKDEMQKVQEILQKNLKKGDLEKVNEMLMRNRKMYASAK